MRDSLRAGHGPDALVQAAAVARRYYLDGLSKVQIAEEFGLSRFKVARILDDARAEGLVQIEIVLPAHLDTGLSDELRAAYGLEHAIVLTTAEEAEASLRAHLGAAAARLLTEIVTEGDVLGIGFGRTIGAVVGALSALPRCSVVQLTGVLTSDVEADGSVELVRKLAGIAGGPMFPIYAPFMVADAATTLALRRQPQVATTLARYHEVSIAVVAVGSWEPPNSTLRDALESADRDRMAELGVQAEVCGVLLDKSGQRVRTDVGDRLLSVTGDELLRVPEVIAVTAGITKAIATRAVVLGGYATSLVTDFAVARYLLDNPPEGSWQGRPPTADVRSAIIEPAANPTSSITGVRAAHSRS